MPRYDKRGALRITTHHVYCTKVAHRRTNICRLLIWRVHESTTNCLRSHSDIPAFVFTARSLRSSHRSCAPVSGFLCAFQHYTFHQRTGPSRTTACIFPVVTLKRQSTSYRHASRSEAERQTVSVPFWVRAQATSADTVPRWCESSNMCLISLTSRFVMLSMTLKRCLRCSARG